MSALPWMKWHPSDWRADPLVRACAPLSRYVWMEMIGLMHEATPYGHLTLAGKKIDAETLSRLISVDLDTVKSALRELKAKGVFSVTEKGVIYSRRMIRDEKKRETLNENAQKGGKKTQAKIKEIQQLSEVLLEQKTGFQLTPRGQRPEARVIEDIPDRQADSSDVASPPTGPAGLLRVFDDVLIELGAARPTGTRRDAEISEKWHRIGITEATIRAVMGEQIPKMLCRAVFPKCPSVIDAEVIQEHHRRNPRGTANGDSNPTNRGTLAERTAAVLDLVRRNSGKGLGQLPGGDDPAVLPAVSG